MPFDECATMQAMGGGTFDCWPFANHEAEWLCPYLIIKHVKFGKSFQSTISKWELS